MEVLDDMLQNLTVHNLTGHALPPGITRYFGLGLSFIPIPTSFSPTSLEDLSSAFIKLHRAVKVRKVVDPKGKNAYKPDKFRLPSGFNPDDDDPIAQLFLDNCLSDLKTSSMHFSALVSARKVKRFSNVPHHIAVQVANFLSDPHYTVCASDKNMGLCVLLSTLEDKFAFDHLLDVLTYTEVSLSHANALIRRFFCRVKRWLMRRYGEDWETADLTCYLLQITPISQRFAKFKNLVKLHKSPVVSRPLACQNGSVTYALSKWLHSKLLPAVKHFTQVGGTIATDSRSVVQSLETTRFPSDCAFTSQDITALYPSIPIDDALRVIRILLSELHKLYCPQSVSDVLFLLELVLKTNVVNYKGRLFLQIKGGAMGTPVLVCVAILYVYYMERNLVADWLSRGLLLFYRRFIDDIFAVFLNQDALESFFTEFNSLNTNIQCSGMASDSVVWLDVTVFKGSRFAASGLLDIKIYQKPLNLFLYLPFNTNHPFKTKAAFIREELKRYIRNCSSFSDYLVVRSLFLTRLRARGFPFRLLVRCFAQARYSNRQSYLFPCLSPPVSSAPRFFIVLRFNRTLDDLNVNGVLKKHWKLLQQGTFPHLFRRPPLIALKNENSIAQQISKVYAKRYAFPAVAPAFTLPSSL